MHHRKEKSKLFKIMAIIFIMALVFIILSLDRWIKPDSTFRILAKDAKNNVSKVYFGSEAYIPKSLKTYLIMGVDSPDEVKITGMFRNNLQADFLMLVIIDDNNKNYKLLQINRDTMMLIDEYGVAGTKYGEGTMQIAMSHTYGDGTSNSGMYTKNAVSRLLKDYKIDYYLSLTMPAVPIINDYVAPDGLLVNGKKLSGNDALTFVRQRMNVGQGTNIERISRQQDYIKSLIKTINVENLDAEKLNEAYSLIEDYICTDGTTSDIYKVVDYLSNYSFDGNIYELPGEAFYDNTYVEYYLDEDASDNVIKELLYEKL